jgi:hypothetical protein
MSILRDHGLAELLHCRIYQVLPLPDPEPMRFVDRIAWEADWWRGADD